MSALILGLMTFAGAGPLIVVGWLGVAGRLQPNRWAGIRTRYTLSSAERWRATHRAAGPVMLYGGVAAAAAGLAFLPFVIAGAVPDGLSYSVFAAQVAIVLVSAIFSALYGIGRAKALERAEVPGSLER